MTAPGAASVNSGKASKSASGSALASMLMTSMRPWRSMAKTSPERRFIEASQLAGMQGRALAPQNVERSQANLKVLANSPLVKGTRRTRQLDLPMQRLVGDTQQRPIRHTQRVALRRHKPSTVV